MKQRQMAGYPDDFCRAQRRIALRRLAWQVPTVLLRFSPQEYSFYPRCPFYALTGHYCPGCGATRAIAELLHGHVAAALHFQCGSHTTDAHAALVFCNDVLDGGARQSCRVAASPAVVMESCRLPASCSLA